MKLFSTLFLLLVFAAAAQAATFTVNTNLDNEANGCGVGLCTLREAITTANTNAQPDIIAFDPTFFNVARTITLNGTDLTIASDQSNPSNTMTINGTGANLLTISGNNVSRVLYLGVSATVTVTGLTITGGNGTSTVNGSNGFGGGIIITDEATLNLTGVAVSGNTTGTDGLGLGGGIYTISSLNVTNSTISGNSAGVSGGGIYKNGMRMATVTNCTISGNTTGINPVFSGTSGGGINNSRGVLNVFNSTITNNTARTDGGGVSTAQIALTNVRSSIIAGNFDTDGGNIDAAGIFTSQGYNLIGIVGAATGFTGTADQVGTAATPINPQLSPLSFYGGTTQTHALLSNSPAIDKGNSFTLTTDQRGSPRPVDSAPTNAGDGADIGAFELQIATASGVTVSGKVMTPTGKALSRVTVIMTDMQGIARSVSTDRRGGFIFTDVRAGETYVFEIRSKLYHFNSQVITVSEDLDGVDFTATN